MIRVPGLDEALVYAFKDDNQGPPSPAEVHKVLGPVNERGPFSWCPIRLVNPRPPPRLTAFTGGDLSREGKER